MGRTRKQIILDRIEDLVSSFIYYDRKDDEELKVNEIEEAIKNREISIQEIIEKFEDHFCKYIHIELE